MTELALENLSVQRGDARVLDGLSLNIQPGECVGLLGPNGAGKTTLMRAALGLMPHDGQSSFAALSADRRARTVAWLPQSREIAWPVTVETLVGLGRGPHGGLTSETDNQTAVNRALTQCGLGPLRHRKATDLSGGEQARVLIARALAQDTPFLFADEPTAGLDPVNQLSSMDLFAAHAAQGRSVLVSLHDLSLAARSCSRLVVLKAGRKVADGPPRQVLTEDLVGQVFKIRCRIREELGQLHVQALEPMP